MLWKKIQKNLKFFAGNWDLIAFWGWLTHNTGAVGCTCDQVFHSEGNDVKEAQECVIILYGRPSVVRNAAF